MISTWKPDEVLTGGNVATEMVRLRPAVRKPSFAQMAGVEDILNSIAESSSRVPAQTFGRDDRGTNCAVRAADPRAPRHAGDFLAAVICT
jgi:hypothetical protein